MPLKAVGRAGGTGQVVARLEAVAVRRGAQAVGVSPRGVNRASTCRIVRKSAAQRLGDDRPERLPQDGGQLRVLAPSPLQVGVVALPGGQCALAPRSPAWPVSGAPVRSAQVAARARGPAGWPRRRHSPAAGRSTRPRWPSAARGSRRRGHRSCAARTRAGCAPRPGSLHRPPARGNGCRLPRSLPVAEDNLLARRYQRSHSQNRGKRWDASASGQGVQAEDPDQRLPRGAVVELRRCPARRTRLSRDHDLDRPCATFR